VCIFETTIDLMKDTGDYLILKLHEVDKFVRRTGSANCLSGQGSASNQENL